MSHRVSHEALLGKIIGILLELAGVLPVFAYSTVSKSMRGERAVTYQ
jgi:hypothetical protein